MLSTTCSTKWPFVFRLFKVARSLESQPVLCYAKRSRLKSVGKKFEAATSADDGRKKRNWIIETEH